jgi:amino acid adenylation domain-containing protein
MTNMPEQNRSDDQRALLKQLLREKARKSVSQYPLSYGQQALWYIQQVTPETSVYNVAFSVRVPVAIDVAALQRALQALVERHAVLRTTFVVNDTGVMQQVYGYAEPNLEIIDASNCTETEMAERVADAQDQPFDIEHGSLLRLHLFRRSPEEHILLMVQHHTLTDGWSIGILARELRMLYQAEVTGQPANLPKPDVQYPDFVQWQREMLAGSESARMREYWHQQLHGELPLLNLPLDHPRPQQQSFNGALHQIDLGSDMRQRLHDLAHAEHTTLYVLLLSAFQALLQRYTGQEDIIVGTPVVGRSRARFQQTTGYFVNLIPLRLYPSAGMSFRQLVTEARNLVHQALAHQDYPFPLLVEELDPARESGRSPIIETVFNLLQTQRIGIDDNQEGFPMEPFPLRQQTTQFDLMSEVIETEQTIHLSLRYNTDLFESTTIERMIGHFQLLLDGVLANPDQPIGAFSLLPPAERQGILADWNETTQPLSDKCLHELITEQAARTPDAVAATSEGNSISYRQLDQRANQLAHYLRNLGIGPDRLVGVYVQRSLDMLVALLGVLKAGGAYVPLDPSFPRERLEYMLEDSAAAVLISQAELLEDAPAYNGRILAIDSDWPDIAAMSSDAPPNLNTPEHLTYVIYTSGSTGKPKGVQLPHRAVVNFLQTMREQPGIEPNDRLLAVTTLSFDIAVLELYLPLLIGAQVILADRETAADGDLLRELIETSAATVMQATPITWKLLLHAGWQPARPFKALCGGEALPIDLARDLLATGVELWNMYGPTETTVWSTIHQVTHTDGLIPIGRPIANTQVYVLNEQLQPAPIGVLGELYIGGAGVARGYHNRPDLTNERFVPNPFHKEQPARIYRTGDLARWRSDGILEVLGRVDHQVKIRGFRIELGEIETVLQKYPDVRQSVVVAREAPNGERRLIAYFTTDNGQAPGSADLRRHLRDQLPPYMVPALFVRLDALPLTPNGKIDRRALPEPDRERAESQRVVTPPSTPTEQLLVEIWREVLETDRVGVHDNFFDLGGHSLQAVETMHRIETRSGVKLSPAMLRVQTLGQLAIMIDQQPRTEAAAPAAAEAPAVAEEPDSGATSVFGALKRMIRGRS